jgi:hypothetical protein
VQQNNCNALQPIDDDDEEEEQENREMKGKIHVLKILYSFKIESYHEQ